MAYASHQILQRFQRIDKHPIILWWRSNRSSWDGAIGGVEMQRVGLSWSPSYNNSLHTEQWHIIGSNSQGDRCPVSSQPLYGLGDR
jgi:hypothetical protein